MPLIKIVNNSTEDLGIPGKGFIGVGQSIVINSEYLQGLAEEERNKIFNWKSDGTISIELDASVVQFEDRMKKNFEFEHQKRFMQNGLTRITTANGRQTITFSLALAGMFGVFLNIEGNVYEAKLVAGSRGSNNEKMDVQVVDRNGNAIDCSDKQVNVDWLVTVYQIRDLPDVPEVL